MTNKFDRQSSPRVGGELANFVPVGRYFAPVDSYIPRFGSGCCLSHYVNKHHMTTLITLYRLGNLKCPWSKREVSSKHKHPVLLQLHPSRVVHYGFFKPQRRGCDPPNCCSMKRRNRLFSVKTWSSLLSSAQSARNLPDQCSDIKMFLHKTPSIPHASEIEESTVGDGLLIQGYSKWAVSPGHTSCDLEPMKESTSRTACIGVS